MCVNYLDPSVDLFNQFAAMPLIALIARERGNVNRESCFTFGVAMFRSRAKFLCDLGIATNSFA
jgi:hypothetical protein